VSAGVVPVLRLRTTHSESFRSYKSRRLLIVVSDAPGSATGAVALQSIVKIEV
jgi:hypothetical protein